MSSTIFQLGSKRPRASSGASFSAHGFISNPFPADGVDSEVFYSSHLESELERVNSWLEESQVNADGFEEGHSKPFRPLAIRGSIGVGKTHLLRSIERGLASTGNARVLRKALTDDGMQRILLSTVLLTGLPREGNSNSGLVGAILRNAKKSEFRLSLESCLSELGDGSILAGPLMKLLLLSRRDSEAVEEGAAVLWRWVQRSYTAGSQRARLGIARTLEGEGEAIQVVADLARCARAAGVFSCWYLLLDQLEEIWRPGVITDSRRARLLTDLRSLVDRSLEGAPIAVLLTWNTQTDEAHWRSEYLALWRRLGEPVDLPALRDTDIWPFAERYISVAPRSDERKSAEFVARLKAEVSAVRSRLDGVKSGVQVPVTAGRGRYLPYAVLNAWRDAADSIVGVAHRR